MNLRINPAQVITYNAAVQEPKKRSKKGGRQRGPRTPERPTKALRSKNVENMSLSELQASLAAKQNLNAQLQPKSIEIQVLRSQEKESTNKGVDDEKQIDNMSLAELQASLAAKRILDAQLKTDSEQSNDADPKQKYSSKNGKRLLRSPSLDDDTKVLCVSPSDKKFKQHAHSMPKYKKIENMTLNELQSCLDAKKRTSPGIWRRDLKTREFWDFFIRFFICRFVRYALWLFCISYFYSFSLVSGIIFLGIIFHFQTLD